MRSVTRDRFAVLGFGLLVLAAAGCPATESGEGQKIGRYRFIENPAGLEIRESTGWLTRLFDSFFGRSSTDPSGRAKIRVGAFRGEPHDYPLESVSDVVVRARKLQGPKAKPTAMKRPWEARLLGAADEALPPAFYFRHKDEAAAFAAEVKRRIVTLGGSLSRSTSSHSRGDPDG